MTYQASEAKTIGHFELLDRIGVGSFGSVWRARDTELDRTVAVKIPCKGQLDAAETEQFLREARAAAQLRHPNIVSVHEVGREEDTVFIVSDYVDGLTLEDWLSAKQFSAREAAALCVKLADALHHAHEAGVVHRDLKPGNIILDADGEPHIMDFGLARREAGEVTMTVEGRVLGTPAYMSPEQAKGESHQADRRSDIYSSGVVLFELLTGERPFRGSARMLLHQIIHDDAPSPRKLVASVPRDLETICLKCLEKDPGKRYTSAKHLGDDLQRCLAGESIAARPITRLERAWRWSQRKPTVATLSAAVVLVTIGGFAGVLWQWLEAEDARKTAQASEGEIARQLDEIRVLRGREIQSYQASEHALYAARMNVAQMAWRIGDMAQLRQVLSPYSQGKHQNLRGFEWQLWNRVASAEQAALSGHKMSVINDVAVAPNGHWIAACGLVGKTFQPAEDSRRPPRPPIVEVAVWELATGRLVFSDDVGEQVSFSWLAFSPDSSRLASRAAGGFVIWDSATGQRLDEIRVDAIRANAIPPYSDGGLGFDSENRLTAFFPEERVVSRLAADGTWETLFDAFDETPRWLALTRDASHVVWSDSDHSLHVTNLNSGDEVARLDAHDEATDFLVPDLASERVIARDQSGQLLIWNIGDGTSSILRNDPAPEDYAFRAAALSPDGRRLAASTGAFGLAITIWDPSSRQEVARLHGHSFPVLALDFAPDGEHLVTTDGGGHNLVSLLRPPYPPGAIKVWNTEWARLYRERELDYQISDIRFSPDGRKAAWKTDDGRIELYDFAEDAVEASLELDPVPVDLAFDVESRLVSVRAADSESAALYQLRTEEKLATILGQSGCVNQFRLSRDGNWLAMCNDKELRLANLRSADRAKLLCDAFDPSSQVQSMAFSGDGRYLAVCTGGRVFGPNFPMMTLPSEVIVWSTQTGREVRRLPRPAAVTSLAFSPRSSELLALGTENRSLLLWDVKSSDAPRELPGHRTGVSGLAFSPDGRRLASVGPAKIQLWDLTADVRILELDAPQDPATTIQLSNRFLVAIAPTGKLRVWDAMPELGGD